MERKPETVTVDAAGRSWGRVATEVATLLRGKRNPNFTPNLLPLVTVVVRNLTQVHLTTRDRATKHYRHSGYPGGLTVQSFGEQFDRNPKQAFRKSVKRMLPGNKLRERILKHLRVE